MYGEKIWGGPEKAFKALRIDFRALLYSSIKKKKEKLKAFVSSICLGCGIYWYFLVAGSVGLVPTIFPIMRFKPTPFALYAPSSIDVL
jgi:hypothetical protein